MFSGYPEIGSGHMVLPETPGLGLRTGRRSRGMAVGGEGQTTPNVGQMWVKCASQAPARPTRVINVCSPESGVSAWSRSYAKSVHRVAVLGARCPLFTTDYHGVLPGLVANVVARWSQKAVCVQVGCDLKSRGYRRSLACIPPP